MQFYKSKNPNRYIQAVRILRGHLIGMLCVSLLIQDAQFLETSKQHA